MAIPDDKIRVQAIIDRKLAEKIQRLADRMEISQSRMISRLLDAAVEDNEWIIRMFTNKFSRKVLDAFGVRKPKDKPDHYADEK